jgi:hypothetical protein
MLHILLDESTQDRLHSLRRTEAAPKVRDRIEMAFLSNARWSPPRIARHLGYHPRPSAT